MCLIREKNQKLLSILGAIGLVATSSATVISCGSDPISDSDHDDAAALKDIFVNTNISVSNKEDLKKPQTLYELIDSNNGNRISGNENGVDGIIDQAAKSVTDGSDTALTLFHLEDKDGNEIVWDGDVENHPTVDTEVAKIYLEFKVDFTAIFDGKNFEIKNGDAIGFSFNYKG